jgi:phosphonate degradation associated HDIG domain protein
MVTDAQALLHDIAALFDARGAEQYSGEPVTQLEHALQCAALAEAEGADAALVTASLLHDLGHLLQDLGATPTLAGIDDRHQYYALPFLRPLFGPEVLEPIRLHVDAKRYLCAVRPGYHAALSADSQRSLLLQGGVFDAAQQRAFEARPYWRAALSLRLWDDRAKAAGAPTPPLAYFLDRAAAVARAAPAP